MGKFQPFRLDDNTIIYIQSDEDIDPSELTQALETPLASNSDNLEDDLEPPIPATPSSNSDEELEDYGAKPKSWSYPNRHGVPITDEPSERPTSPAPPTPAQRVGTLVKAYTTHIVKDIRDTALTEVQVEKVALEFGIVLDAKAQIPYIASSSAECSVKVTIECKLTPPQAAQDTESSSENPS